MSRLFSKEEEQFILENYKGIYNYDLAKKVNKEFGTNYTAQQVKNYKNRHMLDSGLSGPVRPIGSENSRGDIVKTEDGTWKTKKRAVWEKHNGEIPEDHVVIALDGNKNNLSIENLEIVPKWIASIIFHNKLIYSDPELTRLGMLIARNIYSTNKRKKKK